MLCRLKQPAQIHLLYVGNANSIMLGPCAAMWEVLNNANSGLLNNGMIDDPTLQHTTRCNNAIRCERCGALHLEEPEAMNLFIILLIHPRHKY